MTYQARIRDHHYGFHPAKYLLSLPTKQIKFSLNEKIGSILWQDHQKMAEQRIVNGLVAKCLLSDKWAKIIVFLGPFKKQIFIQPNAQYRNIQTRIQYYTIQNDA